jgi:hypothetical protein
MAQRLNHSVRKQVRRVAAWIYVVINPIIDGLQRELSLLESANLTWRARTRQCEMIKKIQEYVDSTQWPNYQDFLAEHPRSVFVTGFKQHDSNVEGLNNVAQVLFDRLLSWPEFQKEVQSALTTYENQRASLGPRAQSLSDMGKDIPEEIAQHVINNVQVLPSHYIISQFWNEVGSNLLSFRNRPEFGPLHQAREKLLQHSTRLKQALESHRLTLSRRYDVPAAPVPGVSFEEY